MTTVYFYLDAEDDDELITDVQYDGYPHFKQGDRIRIQLNNSLPEKWDVKPFDESYYEVTHVEHSALKYYGNTINYSVSIYVYLKKFHSL